MLLSSIFLRGMSSNTGTHPFCTSLLGYTRESGGAWLIGTFVSRSAPSLLLLFVGAFFIQKQAVVPLYWASYPVGFRWSSAQLSSALLREFELFVGFPVRREPTNHTTYSTRRRDSSGRLNVSDVTVLVRRLLLCAMNHPLPAFPCVGRTLRYYCSRRLCAAVLAKRRTFLAVQNRSPAIINHHPLTS